MEVDYVYAADGKPYISYVTVEWDQVKHLRKAIWIQEREELVKYGIGADSRLSLWKVGGEKPLELDRLLTGGVDPVFKDGERKKVWVTPVHATVWDAGFVVRGTPDGSFTYAAGMSGAAFIDRSSVIAQQLLQPFSTIPRSVEELREALQTPLQVLIPLRDRMFNAVAVGCPLGFQMFKIETPQETAPTIACSIEEAIVFCLGRNYAGQSSANINQSYWDIIFVHLWRNLLAEGAIAGITYTRNTASHSGSISSRKRSDLSLLVHGKEVLYGEEDSGINTDAGAQLRAKFRGFLDPTYFLDMSHMVCLATKDLVLKVHAVSQSEYSLLFPAMDIQSAKGLLKSILLSINVLRLAVTWEPGFATTPAREEKLCIPAVNYGSGREITRTLTQYFDGVKKTISPWSEHVAAGYTKEEYVMKAFSALGKYAKSVNVKNDKYELVIADRGERRKPRNCEELKECLKHVLTSLSKLHQVNIVHRDIRWDNIVYVASTKTWLLIDYETVWEANVKPECLLKVFELKGILEGDGTYSKTSDLKLVGKLIDEVFFNVKDLSDFRLNLCEGEFSDAVCALAYLEP